MRRIKAKTQVEKYFLRFVFIILLLLFPIKILADLIPKGLKYEVRDYKQLFYLLWRR